MTQQFMTGNIFTTLGGKASRTKNVISVFAVTLLAVLVSLILAPKAHATTYDVTLSSSCTLPQALEAAATDAIVGTCAAGDGDDTINVGAGAYNLSAALGAIVVPGNISIIGENAVSTIIDGGGFGGVTIGAAGNYLLENLTFQNFTSSPTGETLLVNVAGNVTANKLIVKDNACVTPAAFLPVCAIALTAGTEDITTTISNSAFYNNSALFLFANARPPGSLVKLGTSFMNIFNNTIYDNNSGIINVYNGADADGTAVANVYNNTIVNNTASETVPFMFAVNLGDGFSAELNLRNNILSGNKLFDDTTAANCYSYGGSNSTITSDGGNISSDGTCIALFTGTNDQNSTDPLLAAYQQVGSTFVMPLQAGSPALENAVAGTPATPGFDQRGVTRPQSAIADSGAYEYVALTPTPTPGTLASTGWDTRLPVLLATLFVLAGLTGVGYAVKKN